MDNNVLITIDTEGPAGINPVDSLIYGKTRDGKEYGINYLMDIFDEYSAKGLFFVDIAEAWDCGKDTIAKVITDIRKRGHDVGVHIHPDHMADPQRRFLWEYTYDEQHEIITKCTQFYKDVTGVEPISFRAGRYGANDDTILILDELGYRFDMSEFANNKRCKITPHETLNQIRKLKDTGITEVPVSVFKSFNSPFYSRYDKVDVSQTFGEYKKVVQEFEKKAELKYMVFFIHSFSFLKWRKNPDFPDLDKSTLKKTYKMLEYLKNREWNFCCEEELEKITVNNNMNSDYLGEINVSGGCAQFVCFGARAISNIYAKLVRNV